MPDSVVSVRMPESLMEELRRVASEQHYMDLSEAVRNLVRRKIAEQGGSPVPGNGVATEQLINGLRNIIDELENGVEQG